MNPILFKKQEQKEEIELPKEAQSEWDEVDFYASLIEGQVHKFSIEVLLRAHFADQFSDIATLAHKRLQDLNPLAAMTRLNAQSIKDHIASSTLAKTPSFAERKAQLAQSARSADSLLEIGRCYLEQSEGLPAAQQKEMRDAIIRAQTGQNVEALMIPFAALSKLIKFTMKGLYLGAVVQGCSENGSGDFKQCIKETRDAFEGRDPEFTRTMIASMPKWILKSGQLIAQGDHKLETFDKYMVEQYYTTPGIVHEGIHGMIDVALPSVIGGTIKIAGRTVGTAVKMSRDASQINQLVQVLYREATRGSVELIGFERGMSAAVKDITSYPTTAAFASSIHKTGRLPVFLKDTSEVLPEVCRGRSLSAVYFLENERKALPFVVKEYPGLVSPSSSFSKEVIAYDVLQGLNLNYLQLPKLLKVGKIKPEGNPYYRGLLAMSRLKGKSISEMLEGITKLRGQSRELNLFEFNQIVNTSGKAIGELHGRQLAQMFEPSKELIDIHCKWVSDYFKLAEETLASQQFAFRFTQKEIDGIIADFVRNPGRAGYTHGDAHFQNFIVMENKLGAIDPGSLAYNLDKFGRPRGIQAMDIASMRVTGEYFAERAGLSEVETARVLEEFMQGYAAEFSLEAHSVEALRFYECYWRLFVMNYNLLSHGAWLKTIERLNVLCGRV